MTPSSESWDMLGHAYSFDQKTQPVMGPHNVKVGFRWTRQGGGRLNPQNPEFRYQTKADLLAKQAERRNTVVRCASITTPTWTSMADSSRTIGASTRGSCSTLACATTRIGYTGQAEVGPSRPDRERESGEHVHFAKTDFGAIRPPGQAYEPDRVNFGPELVLPGQRTRQATRWCAAALASLQPALACDCLQSAASSAGAVPRELEQNRGRR